MSWKRLALLPLICLANGYSWASYILGGYPDDKIVYRRDMWGWNAPDMQPHWDDLYKSSNRFHELKNVGVEYARLHAQPAMKSLCMFLVLGWIGCFTFMALSLLLLLV